MPTLHQMNTHPIPVDDCFGCKVGSVQLMGCTPSRSKGAGRSDRTQQKRWDKELDLYRNARSQGIQPAGTTTAKIRKAVDLSNAAGAAFDATTHSFKA